MGEGKVCRATIIHIPCFKRVIIYTSGKHTQPNPTQSLMYNYAFIWAQAAIVVIVM